MIIKHIYIIALFNCLFHSDVSKNDVVLDIIINNYTSIPFEEGDLIILDPNKKIQFSKTVNISKLKTSLPIKKGKYLFQFRYKDFVTEIIYPKKITLKKNIIKINISKQLNKPK